MSGTLDKHYWNERYRTGDIGWDMGRVSPPLEAFINQYPHLNARILIPGGGNSYEAKYLWDKGFTDITVVDISDALVLNLKRKYRETGINFIAGDFFRHDGEYDLILEQTFLSAIDPALRERYAQKMHQLLWLNGRFVGVIFKKNFEQPGPPFGGSVKDYRRLFEPYFNFHIFAPCINSHPARQGNELFFSFRKREKIITSPRGHYFR
ncbi:thiopurine S-methyltransferase [Chitinophaga skermanii]|uniref:Thiopurine S-methyltransferase n=1 Tax=Chitinophaga skermanii TaxID=331697 RepID=A0A327QE27_9BACT|nr:methyltransferase domain-containing protein [Chitinophaga skermanii]RAI99896.1 thiopurine S-methyltransferase [Chitinophaga skermanii]